GDLPAHGWSDAAVSAEWTLLAPAQGLAAALAGVRSVADSAGRLSLPLAEQDWADLASGARQSIAKPIQIETRLSRGLALKYRWGAAIPPDHLLAAAVLEFYEPAAGAACVAAIPAGASRHGLGDWISATGPENATVTAPWCLVVTMPAASASRYENKATVSGSSLTGMLEKAEDSWWATVLPAASLQTPIALELEGRIVC
ncbi:MAG: hypothetical protein LBI84_10730, partial [Propionibacteriaceae bacterium]|nr:hypothetical protein [Propionibacteriaceae bacterium]